MAGLATTTCPFKSSSSHSHIPRPSLVPFSLRFHTTHRVGAFTAVLAARFALQGDNHPPGRSVETRALLDDEDGEFDSDQSTNLDGITSTFVRLIDEQQNMVGVVSKEEALQMAKDVGMDLVIISEDADPPVVKITDFSKYMYEQQKKKRGQQKRSSATRMDIKELKMRYNIGDHDYSVRLKAAIKFLEEGDKIKVVVLLKGRSVLFRSEAIKLMKRLQTDLGELAKLESKDFGERIMSMILMPNKNAIQKKKEQMKRQTSEVSTSV